MRSTLIMIVLVSMVTFAHPALGIEASSLTQLKEDITWARHFLNGFTLYVKSLQEVGYEQWGFTPSTTTLTTLEKLLNDAQVAVTHNNPAHALELLEYWEDVFDDYDQAISQSLHTAQVQYLKEEWVNKGIASIDTWLGEMEQQGYSMQEWRASWQQLRDQFATIYQA